MLESGVCLGPFSYLYINYYYHTNRNRYFRPHSRLSQWIAAAHMNAKRHIATLYSLNELRWTIELPNGIREIFAKIYKIYFSFLLSMIFKKLCGDIQLVTVIAAMALTSACASWR